MRKALIFDPYLNILGGGERYILTFAKTLSELGFKVDIAWSDNNTLKQAENLFGLDLTGLKINPTAYLNATKGNFFQKYFFQKDFDLIFWVSDGSLPFLFAKKNFLHLQVPFTKFGGNKILDWLKSLFIKKFIFNSNFTQSVLEQKTVKNKNIVLYPPVDVKKLSVKKKEKMILSVARFSSIVTSKKQDLLIETFKDFSKKMAGYKLVLAGGLVGSEDFLQRLTKLAKGLNIEIIANPKFPALKDLYAKSKFFWHAAGYGVDELKEPEKVEHFGITTVEAMGSGSIPLVIGKGGQKEIIQNGENGFLCESLKEISEKTLNLANSIEDYERISKNAAESSQKFSLLEFKNQVNKIISQ